MQRKQVMALRRKSESNLGPREMPAQVHQVELPDGGMGIICDSNNWKRSQKVSAVAKKLGRER